MILLPLFVASIVAQDRVGRPDPVEVARARAFLRVAHLDLEGAVVPYDDRTEPTVDDTDLAQFGTRDYWFADAGWVNIDSRTGCVTHYMRGGTTGDTAPALDPSGEPLPRALTDDQAVALARRAYAASGCQGEMRVKWVKDLEGDNGTCVEVRYEPSYEGVPYEGWACSVELERQTGRLDRFDNMSQPLPPASTLPGGTPSEALLAALRVVSAWKGRPFAAGRVPFRLALTVFPWDRPLIGRSRMGGRVWSYGPAQLAEGRAGRALLVYGGYVVGPDGTSVPVQLDARNGAVLEMGSDPFILGTAGGIGASPTPAPTPKPPTKPILVLTASRPWRVATGGTGWKSWSPPATATLTPATSKPPAGAKLTLTDGNAAFPATYDAKSGLLAISGKGYRPGPALAALLKRRR